MATFDHIPTLSSRISPFVLDHSQCKFLESLSACCASYDLKELIPTLCSCIDDFTEFHTAFILLRPECETGNNLPQFADLSAFDLRLDNSGFVMRMHDDGLEIFAVIKDKNGKRGRLNLALAIMPDSGSNPRMEAEKLRIALEKSTMAGSSSADIQKDSFISNLVHQIRRPLDTILTSAPQIVKSGGDKFDDDRRLVESVNREAERIKNILCKCSSYALAGTGEPEKISATSLIQIIKSIISEKGYDQSRISYRYTDGLADSEIMIDAGRLREAIHQVLENAFEAVDENTGAVEIAIGRNDEFVEISIRNNGSAIRPELLRKVKEPFFSTREGGSGLGLAIVEKICRANGGKLQIAGPSPGGTSVTISFPRKERLIIKE